MEMKPQAVVLISLKGKRVLVTTTKKDYQEFQEPKEIIQFFQTLRGQKVVLLGIMEGQYQSLFSRVAQLGIPVWRIPMFRLQELTGFTLKALPKERTEALRQAWETSSDYFYPMKPLEGTIELLRQLTRTRESIQTTIRESAQFRLLSALREIRFILPLETGKAVEPIEEAIKRLSGKQSFQDEIKKALQELESALPGEEKKEFFPLLNLSLIPDLSLEQKKMKKG